MTMLTPERWQQMEALFEQALDWPPEEREQRLERTCGDDAELYRQVLELLGRHERLEGFLDCWRQRWYPWGKLSVPIG